MRHVVAGGGGFIGSHFCDALLARGDEVVALDNFVSGRPQNISHLDNHPGFTLIKQDITLPLPELDGPIDTVLNLASPASPVDFARIPVEILDAGSIGSRNLLDLAVHHDARYLYASTSEVYGDPLVHPQSESYLGNVSPIGPRSCYDEAKRFGEALTMAYHRAHGLDVRIVRIFNTYGERMRPDDGRVVTNFVVQALKGEALTVYGDGSQTRSFTYVSDEVDGLLAVLDGPLAGPVNVGNPNEFTMRELAELVLELTDSESPIEVLELPAEREGDPMQRCPDITLISGELGWRPSIALREGLRRMIDWMREHETF
jgi:nucleoside-diphosphate-sugar epimerase